MKSLNSTFAKWIRISRMLLSLLLFAVCVYSCATGVVSTPLNVQENSKPTFTGPVAIMPVVFRELHGERIDQARFGLGYILANPNALKAFGTTSNGIYVSPEWRNLQRFKNEFELTTWMLNENSEYSDEVKEWKNKTAALSAVMRQYMAELLKSQGIDVIPFQELDPIISEVIPEFWHEDSRGKQQMKTFAEKTGAQRVIFYEIPMGPFYSQSSGIGRSKVWFPGNMEIYDVNGRTTDLIVGNENTPAESVSRAIMRLLIGAGANILMPAPGNISTPGPGKLKYHEVEIRSLENLTRVNLAVLLGSKDLPDLEVKTLEATSLKGGYRAWGSRERKIPLVVKGGTRIGILSEGIHICKNSVNSMTIQSFDGKNTQKILIDMRKAEKESSQFAASIAIELEKACKAWGCLPVLAQKDEFACTVTRQNFSKEYLTGQATKLGCDIIIYAQASSVKKVKNDIQGRIFLKVVDIRSGTSWEGTSWEGSSWPQLFSIEATAEELARIVFGNALRKE